MSILPRLEKMAQELLWQEMEKAIGVNTEFDYPEFKNGLKKAAFTPGIITIKAGEGISPGQFGIKVKIHMNAIAGDIREYKAAVEAVRAERVRDTEVSLIRQMSHREMTPRQYNIAQYYSTPEGQQNLRKRASFYWKNFIYGQAREGKGIKIPREKGQKGRTPTRKKEGTELYTGTIKDRFDLISSPAPYWSILDEGIAGAKALDSGGFAHPKAVRTGFVRTAERKIVEAVASAVIPEVRKLSAELEKERYGAGDILEKINRAIAQYGQGDVTWIPGEILEKLELGEKRYNLYITTTGKLGFSQ